MPKGHPRIATLVRRVFAAVLGSLVALQPIGATAPTCAIGGLLSGRGVCCCAEPVNAEAVAAKSCCSSARPGTERDGVSITGSAKRCACEVDAPQPVSALPQDPGARCENGSARSLLHWIDLGAEVSASTPILSTASPPGPAPAEPTPPVSASFAHGLARGARGLLAVTCVARC